MVRHATYIIICILQCVLGRAPVCGEPTGVSAVFVSESTDNNHCCALPYRSVIYCFILGTFYF